MSDAILPYHRGGKEMRYQEISRRLTSRADVHIYTMNWWQGPRVRREGGVTLHAICPLIPLYRGERRSILQALVFTLGCARLMFGRFDAIEADHMPYMPLFVLRLVTWLRRKPLVATWHECWGPGYWRRYLGKPGLIGWWLERLAMLLPDHIVAASDETARRLREHISQGIPVTVAPNGVDLELARRATRADQRSDVIAVGRMLAHKRFDLLIDALALLRDEGDPVFCRIVGDGPEREALRTRASDRGIGHLVEFHHEVRGPEQLYGLLKASRVFAFPSEREGFGIAALEALACGLPVVMTSARDNAASSFVQQDAASQVSEPTALAFASAIRRALGSDVDAGPREWIREFDWDTVTDRVADVLLGPQPPVSDRQRMLEPKHG